ncbi:Thiolase-like [Penicillium camemberti]|uniref:Thiolase-like n=1 Tax=Penicillium camemberti (strain FM 013) TaxID=1429867 RepID=A0A0G4PU64_PENC3|nr:Thiolase-like [Penicillium camemberti]
MAPHKVPIIIGVGEAKNPSRRTEDAIEPLHLMLQAIREAVSDACNSSSPAIISSIDSVKVVASSTWPYKDLPGLVCEGLGIKPSHTAYSELAGSASVQLIDDTARMIANEQIQVGVVVGGEAMASLKAFVKDGTYPPPWTTPEKAQVYYANDTDSLTGIGRAHRVGVPMHVYPMYENALRWHRGQSPLENLEESSSLYGQFADIASKHPMAWNSGKSPKTAKEIGSITKNNRMICFPYPLLMNAFNDVNIAGACILTTTECAVRMGIPRDKWIFPLGGGRAEDSKDIWARPNFYTSRAIASALDLCLHSSGLIKDDIDLFDFYSCFPIVPKLACHHLGISCDNLPKPITLLGGLNSFGGAGANYSMHAVAEMVRRLRKLSGTHKPSNGLVLANGGLLTTESAISLSTHARRGNDRYPTRDNYELLPASQLPPSISIHGEGEAIVETYTVEYDRENRPQLGHVVCRLKSNGHRLIANHGDIITLEELSSWTEEPIGRIGFVRRSSTTTDHNLFVFRKDDICRL